SSDDQAHSGHLLCALDLPARNVGRSVLGQFVKEQGSAETRSDRTARTIARGLTPAQAKAYGIADYQAAPLCDWDQEMACFRVGRLQARRPRMGLGAGMLARRAIH